MGWRWAGAVALVVRCPRIAKSAMNGYPAGLMRGNYWVFLGLFLLGRVIGLSNRRAWTVSLGERFADSLKQFRLLLWF
jgi:hypothetical protein